MSKLQVIDDGCSFNAEDSDIVSLIGRMWVCTLRSQSAWRRREPINEVEIQARGLTKVAILTNPNAHISRIILWATHGVSSESSLEGAIKEECAFDGERIFWELLPYPEVEVIPAV